MARFDAAPEYAGLVATLGQDRMNDIGEVCRAAQHGEKGLRMLRKARE